MSTASAQLPLALDACHGEHDTSSCTRCVEAAFADGSFRLLVDALASRDCGYVGRTIKDDKVRVVHVLSKHAGGEIRGYVITDDGVLRLRLPCYTGAWPALDEAVRSRVGAASVEVGAAGRD